MGQHPHPDRIGRYEIVRRIAYGGMAEIFLARATGVGGMSRLVALKCILPSVTEDDDFVDMFLDEMRVASRLSHQSVAHVYDFGEADGQYYIAMELIDGLPLTHLLDALKPETLPVEHALTVGSLVAQGLYYAHSVCDERGQPIGIVHRDVSPQNIMISFDGQVKLLDFGIAKARDQVHHTEHGVLKGKFAYISPEQCVGRPADHRADIFSLGVVVYEMVTGSRLFQRDNALETVRAVCSEPIEPPSVRRPGLPPSIDPVVMKALARDPEHRYSGADDLCIDLEDVIRQEGLLSNPLMIGRFLDLVDPDRYERQGSRRKGAASSSKSSGPDWAISLDSGDVVSLSEVEALAHQLDTVVATEVGGAPSGLGPGFLAEALDGAPEADLPGEKTEIMEDPTRSVGDGVDDTSPTLSTDRAPPIIAEPAGGVAPGPLSDPPPARAVPVKPGPRGSGDLGTWLLIGGAVVFGVTLAIIALGIVLCSG